MARNEGRRFTIVSSLTMMAGLLAAAGVPAGEPREATKVSPEVSPFEVARSLGPGPLTPLIAPRHSAAAKAAGLRRRIDSCVEANMASLDAPGAAVAVMLDGELLYESGYGVKRRGGSDPVDADTVFRIGSVTKMMTAAAVLQQVELGRVALDAPVTEFVPELAIGGRWPADRITVRHALTHTSGFPDHINEVTAVGDEALSRWATLQGGVALHAPPGSFWNYSNPNFVIAGLVAERASGVPYRDLYRESLWEPAGMDATTFDPSTVVTGGNYAFGHYVAEENGRSYVVGPHDNDLWAAGPAGFAFSTVGDLVRWALLLMDGGGPVLSPWSAATMQDRQQWIHLTPDLYYGYGVFADRYRGLDIRQHGGNVAGFGTYLLWVPDRRFAVALLTNVSPSLINAAYCIVDDVLEPEPSDPPDLTTGSATWRRYEGRYVITETDGLQWQADVSLRGDRLHAEVQHPAVPEEVLELELVQLYLDTFLFDGDGDGFAETDVTFCDTPGSPGLFMWTRNRHAVGERQLVPRSTAGRRFGSSGGP